MVSKVIKSAPKLALALVCLSWLGVAAVVHHSPDESCRYSPEPLHPYSAGAQFAIADLDGDQKPDLALVELGGRVSTNTNYSIRLKLSAGSESAVGVNGPFGGLQVAARDVNGDESIDLIVTSNLDASFVEVLLNDGHGNFSLAAPGAYPELQEDSHVLVKGPNEPGANQSSLEPSRSYFGQESASGHGYLSVLSSDLFPSLDDGVALRRSARSRLGRSPPSL
jgi:hypothetical protein